MKRMHFVIGMLLHVLFLLHVQFVLGDLNLSHACSELTEAATGVGRFTDIVSRQNNLVCNKSSPGFVLWSRWISRRNGLIRVVFRRCPRVGRVWILTDSDAHFVPSSTDFPVTSCRNTNDTITLPRNQHNKQKLDIHTLTNNGVDIIVLLEEKDGGSSFYTTHKYHLVPQTKHRHHRARRATEPGTEPGMESSSQNGAVSSSPLSDCGINRTCVRLGQSDCGHMTCDYFLSYYVIGTRIDIELSGKSDGWVAVGFSSDRLMGGGDDVIACKRNDQSTDEVEVQSLLNQIPYSVPKEKQNPMTLEKSVYKDGFIYCRVSRNVKVDMADNLDLSKDWYQLYARGPIEKNGAMLQHGETPLTSDASMTTLVPHNIYISAISKREAQPAPQPVLDENALPSTPLSDCGLNRTCIRFGTRDCDHMTCDYFLSYYVIESETIDIELSGKTDGWIAIGFSSDAKMGGADDIIACKRKDLSTDEIEVHSLLNQVAHSSPKPKPNALTLKKWLNKDGFIYCRVSRNLKVDLANNLDLSNDWYQLYARGPVGNSGVMLQHNDIPPTSKEKITVLITENDFTSSASSRQIKSVGITCLLFSLLAIS